MHCQDIKRVAEHLQGIVKYRITNNFNDAEKIVNDICVWECFELPEDGSISSSYAKYDMPIISKLYTILLEQIELKFKNDTFENLGKDSSYNSWIIEKLEYNYTVEAINHETLINKHKLKGYKEAVEYFNSWKQEKLSEDRNIKVMLLYDGGEVILFSNE